MNWITILALIMIFIGGVGAIALVIGQAKDSARDKQDLINLTKEENVALKSELSELREERNTLKTDLEKRDAKIQGQTANILELNNKLVEKSNYISNYLIGGKGFPTVITSALKPRNQKDDEKVTFTLLNENELPLYDVNVVIFDWNYISTKMQPSDNLKAPYLRQEELTKSMLYRFDEGQMFEGSNVISKNQFDLREALLYIKMKSRSSFVHEKMAFVNDGKRIYSAFIIQDDKGKVLKEWMSPGTPNTESSLLKKKLATIPNMVAFTITQ